MTVTGVAKIAAAIAGAAVSSAAGAMYAHQEHGSQLKEIQQTLDEVRTDVRLLKCAAHFPGVCPDPASKPGQ